MPGAPGQPNRYVTWSQNREADAGAQAACHIRSVAGSGDARRSNKVDQGGPGPAAPGPARADGAGVATCSRDRSGAARPGASIAPGTFPRFGPTTAAHRTSRTRAAARTSPRTSPPNSY